jgi:hypothetical protein
MDCPVSVPYQPALAAFPLWDTYEPYSPPSCGVCPAGHRAPSGSGAHWRAPGGTLPRRLRKKAVCFSYPLSRKKRRSSSARLSMT